MIIKTVSSGQTIKTKQTWELQHYGYHSQMSKPHSVPNIHIDVLIVRSM